MHWISEDSMLISDWISEIQCESKCIESSKIQCESKKIQWLWEILISAGNLRRFNLNLRRFNVNLRRLKFYTESIKIQCTMNLRTESQKI